MQNGRRLYDDPRRSSGEREISLAIPSQTKKRRRGKAPTPKEDRLDLSATDQAPRIPTRSLGAAQSQKRAVIARLHGVCLLEAVVLWRVPTFQWQPGRRSDTRRPGAIANSR